MSKDGGDRFDGDDKIIDITNYVHNHSEEELEMENFTNHFLEMFNKGIIEKQREEARKRFIYFMINFLLCTQIAVIVTICFVVAKVYS